MPRPRRHYRSRTGVSVDVEEKGLSGKDPFGGDSYYRAYGSYLGQFDPDAISISTMQKMLRHPAIALAEHVIWAPLISAEWEIECADDNKRKFVEAVVKEIYLKLMMFSVPAISLGFSAFTKQWGPLIPYDKDGNPLWPKELIDAEILPIVPVDLKQLHPLTVEPVVEQDVFKGVRQKNFGFIDPLYACWITHHRHKVWGNLWGWPLLTNVYPWWWSSGFRSALMNRHIEDRVSPALVVDFPPGYIEDQSNGTKVFHRQSALATGKAIRAGETVALPSDFYTDDNGRPVSRKWDARFLHGGENIGAFIQAEDASDVRILMGMLIPPQALLQAKGGIGSQSVAQTLGEIFWVSQEIRKKELDQQFTDYVVRPIEQLNWPEGPSCKLVTKRFKKEDQEIVIELIKLLMNRQDMNMEGIFDIGALIDRVGLPKGDFKAITKNLVEGGAPK